MRPPELSTDTAPTLDVLKHALSFMEEGNTERYDMVLLLEPTSPIRTPTHIDSAIELLAANDQLSGVVSVSEPFFNPVWVGVRPSEGDEAILERYFKSGEGVSRRQDLDRFLHINGNFYVWRSEFVRTAEGMWFDAGPHGYVETEEIESFSIDDEREFKLIEALVQTGLVQLPLPV